MLNSKKAGFIWTILYVLLSGVCFAQKVTLVNSTQRHWSGGIAGRSGINYTFSIRFEGSRHEPQPDTIWIGDQPVKILLEGNKMGSSSNTHISRSGKSILFDITAGTSRDEYTDRYAPYPGQKDLPEKPHPPVAYSGVALFSYNVQGKRKYYIVSKILHTYQPVSYP